MGAVSVVRNFAGAVMLAAVTGAIVLFVACVGMVVLKTWGVQIDDGTYSTVEIVAFSLGSITCLLLALKSGVVSARPEGAGRAAKADPLRKDRIKMAEDMLALTYQRCRHCKKQIDRDVEKCPYCRRKLVQRRVRLADRDL